MSDPPLPPPPGPEPSALRPHQVRIKFDVLARSQAEADALIEEVLIEELAGPPDQLRTDGRRIYGEAFGPDTSHVLSWFQTPAVPAPEAADAGIPGPGWEAFEDSGIPEIVARMFPPLPSEADYRSPDGSVDAVEYENALQDWRDQCLDLATQAARLPELLARLDDLEHAGSSESRVVEAERLRDALIDLVARDSLPVEPQKEDYLVTVAPSFEGEFEDMRFAWDHTQWRSDFTATALRREQTLQALLAEGGPRTTYLPEQFHHAWVPADLIALYTLRSIVDGDPDGKRSAVTREQADALEALLDAADPDVRVLDPDDPGGVELYAGPASEAHDWLPFGVYDATGPDGEGEFRLVVGPIPGDPEVTASAAFPPVEQDSAVLGEIARILEQDAEIDQPTVMLARINAVVKSTGRVGALDDEIPATPLTRLERGALLSDLLAEREQHLDPPENGPEPPVPGAGPERLL